MLIIRKCIRWKDLHTSLNNWYNGECSSERRALLEEEVRAFYCCSEQIFNHPSKYDFSRVFYTLEKYSRQHATSISFK